MKLPTLIMAGLTCARLCVAAGEEWPAEVLAYEQLAAQEPQVGAAFERLWFFASGVGQLDALEARWEAASHGDGAWNWRVLAGLLAERRGAIEEARNHLRRATEMAPAKFASWLAFGEFEARRGTPEAGAAFEKAIPLAASLAEQTRAVAALAAWHRAAGRIDQARAAIEPRFEAARDPDLRLALTPALAEVCFAEGTLSALTEKFEERQRSGDWRFGIYLAEIDTVAQDYAAARKRLEELLAEHPDDLLVVRQAATIARREKRPAGSARLLRFRAERMPDRRVWRDLFVAMLEAGHPAECARLLEEHAPEIGAQPSFWRVQLPQLWQFDLLEPARRAVESQVEKGGWECRLALAELLIAAGREREAAPHLWTVVEATAPALTAQALEIGNNRESPLSKGQPSFPGQTHASRIQGMKLLQEDFFQLAKPSSDLAAPFDVAVETLQDAREEALLQLALLAQHTGEETQFLERLPHALRDWPGGERVLAWAAIEHAPGLLREIAAYAAGPDRQPEADRFCAAQLARLSTLAALKAPPAELARLRDIFSPKEAAAPRAAGRPGWSVAFRKCFDAFIECDFERAGSFFEEGIAARPPPDQLDSFRMSLAHAIRGLRDNRKIAEAAAFAMACIYPRELPRATLAQPLEFFRVLPHNEPHFTFDLMFDVAGPNHYLMGTNFFTPPRLWINQGLNTAMWMVLDNVGENRRAEVLELLERQPRELPGARSQFARLGAAYFAWWMDRKEVTETQLRALLGEVPRDELRIALSGLLTDTNRHGEALAILQEIKPARLGERRQLESWRARVAAAGWKQPVPDDDEEAVEKPPWLRAGDFSAPFSREDAHETIAIPPTAARRWTSLRTGRDLAWRMIDSADERAAVVAALRARTAEAGSLNAWERVAEAETEPERVAAACEKIFALDPDNLLAVRLLAREFAENGGDAKAVLSHAEAAIEHRLVEGVPAPDDELWRLFEKANALPRLAAAIDRAAPGFLARGSSATVSRLDNIAEKLRSLSLDDGAIRVWRKALFLTGANDEYHAAIRRRLVAILARGKDRAAAIDTIADLLLPQSPTPVLFTISSAPDADPVVSNIALIKSAIRFGGLAELRQRGEAAAVHDAGAHRILTLIRVLGRDPGVLPELSAAVFRNVLDDAPFLLSLAEELADWPEAHAVCLEFVAAHARMSPESPGEERLRIAKVAARAGDTEGALKIARHVFEATPPGSNEAQRILPMIGEVAVAAHAPALVGECGRRWLEQNKRARTGDVEDDFKLVGLLIDADCAEEQRLMIAALRENDVVRRDLSWQNRLRILDFEAGLKRGELRQVSPIVWLDADRSVGEQAALVWDVGAMFEGDDARQPVTTGAPLPKMDGRFTIELLFGEDAGDMRTLARLPQAQARGVWRGALPAPAGFVRAILWDGDRAVFADPLPVCLGPDLLRAEAGVDPAWGITQDSVTRVKGGPAVDGEYFSFRPVEPDGPDEPIMGRRVKLTPGRDCVLSGWIRPAANRNARIGWRCLDAQGAVVTGGETDSVITSERIWSYCSTRLAWTPAEGGSSQIPANARYLEPVIWGGGDGFDLASLSLVEITETEPQEAP